MLSVNFSREEFKCKCGKCNYDTVDSELLEVLQDLRDVLKTPILINSANRCPEHNKSVGGSSGSMHLHGRAADIVVSGISPSLIQDHFEHKYPDKFGIGRYGSFTHIDTRTNKARWNG